MRLGIGFAALLVAAALSLSLCFPAGSTAQDCVYYDEYMHWVGGVDTPGSAQSVVVVDNYAYVTCAGPIWYGILVLDLTDPQNPQIAGSIDRTGSLDVSGSYAYIVNDDHGLMVVDITDLENTEVVGSVNLPDNVPRDVAVSGNYAYVVDWQSLVIIDISDPENPQITGSVEYAYEWAWRVAISGNYAYVTENNQHTGGGYLRAIDITNPEAPVVVGSLDTGYNRLPFDVTVSGQHAYIACRSVYEEYDNWTGVLVVDISNLENLQMIGYVGTTTSAESLFVSGSLAYVAEYWYYDFGRSVLEVIDITQPESPQIIGSKRMREARSVAVTGYFAFVADGRSGLQVFDIENPESPPVVGGIDTGNAAHGLAITDSFGYIVGTGNWKWGSRSSLHVIDIANPEAPQLLGDHLVDYDSSYDVAILGDYALVAGDPSLVVFDISDPENPEIASTVDTLGTGRCITVSGQYAYLGITTNYPDEEGSMQVLDISDPENPQIVGSVETPMVARRVVVAGEYAYAACSAIWTYGSGSLHVLDISDPENPQIVGSVETPGAAMGVAIAENYAYVVDYEPGLHVIDVTNPVNPQIVGSADIYGGARKVAVMGSYAYVANGLGVVTIDISNPQHPGVVGDVDTWAADVALANGYAYVAANGLKILPLQCDENTAVDDDVEEPDADGEIPQYGRRLTVHPNPFNPQTTVSFSLERAEWAKIAVYELTGRRVAVLADRVFTAGTNTLNWNGRDSLGRALPSGAYLVRLETEDDVQARKVSLIR